MELPLIARVECRADGQPEERPVAVWVGGRRVEVDQVIEDAVIGGRAAGAPLVRRVRLHLADGQQLRLVRTLPDGEWRVFRRED